MDSKQTTYAIPVATAPSPHGSNSETYHHHDSEDEVANERPVSDATKARIANKNSGIITVQPLVRADMQPTYAQDLGVENIPHGAYGSMIHSLGTCTGLLGSIPCCPFPNPFKSVPQGNVGLVSRFGQFYSAVDPGLVNVNVCSESIKIVDVRIRMDNIPSQSVMTRDNVTVEVESVICWSITSPYRATYGIDNVKHALIERAQTTLRQVVGARTIQSVITEREAIAAEIEEIVESPAGHWGVGIESILIKDITFSKELQESLSAAAQARRFGESKIIAARAEVQSAKLMRETAELLASPAAMSIRTLDALQNIARGANTKVVFVPMNLSNMGASAPGHAAGSNLNTASSSETPQAHVTFPQIAEHSDEHDFIGGGGAGAQGVAGQAGVVHSMASI